MAPAIIIEIDVQVHVTYKQPQPINLCQYSSEGSIHFSKIIPAFLERMMVKDDTKLICYDAFVYRICVYIGRLDQKQNLIVASNVSSGMLESVQMYSCILD